MKNTLGAELLAEFLGTMVLILFGNGVVAMVVLFDKGEYTNITIAWGLAVTMGVYIAGKISGAHLNPAVTLALAMFRDFGPRLLTVVAGFKNNGLTDGSGVFWVPIVGPLIGGLIGAGLYDKVLRPRMPAASSNTVAQ